MDEICGGITRKEQNQAEVIFMCYYGPLEKGRGKGQNVLLTGPANCGKTFCLTHGHKYLMHSAIQQQAHLLGWVRRRRSFFWVTSDVKKLNSMDRYAAIPRGPTSPFSFSEDALL